MPDQTICKSTTSVGNYTSKYKFGLEGPRGRCVGPRGHASWVALAGRLARLGPGGPYLGWFHQGLHCWTCRSPTCNPILPWTRRQSIRCDPCPYVHQSSFVQKNSNRSLNPHMHQMSLLSESLHNMESNQQCWKHRMSSHVWATWFEKHSGNLTNDPTWSTVFLPLACCRYQQENASCEGRARQDPTLWNIVDDYNPCLLRIWNCLLQSASWPVHKWPSHFVPQLIHHH